MTPEAHGSAGGEAPDRRARVDALGDAIAVNAARIDAATQELLGQIREFDAEKGWAWQGAKTCAHWLSWRIGLGIGTAREKVRVARALGELPLVDAAMAAGELSYSKVRAMTRVGNDDNQELLLTFAKSSTGAQLETICRGYRQVARHEEGARRRTDDDERFVRRRALPNGMVRLEAQLYPDEAERVFRALHETRLALSAPAHGNEMAAMGLVLPALAADDGDDAPAATHPDADLPAATHPDADLPAEARRDADVPAEARRDADVPAEARSDADVFEETRRDSEADVPAEAHSDADVPAGPSRDANVPAETRHALDAPAEAHSAGDVAAEAHSAGDVAAEAHSADVPAERRRDAGVPAERRRDAGVPAERRCDAGVPAERRRDAGVPAERRLDADAQAGLRAANPAQLAEISPARPSPHRTSDRRPGHGPNEPDLGDALVAMAESVLARGVRGRSGAERTQLFVHLRQRDIEAQGEPWRPLLHDGTLLSGDTFRRLACDAGLVLAHVDAAGNPLDVGRKTRTIPTALRRALWVRDGGCRFPGCGAQVFVDAHHVQHWCEGGGTSLDNTLLLCDHHHRAVHEDGFSVSLLDGVASFQDPRGRAIPVAPQPPRLGGNAVQSLAERHHRRGIAIGPRTNLPNWDGTPLDRGAAVGALIRKSPPPAPMHH